MEVPKLGKGRGGWLTIISCSGVGFQEDDSRGIGFLPTASERDCASIGGSSLGLGERDGGGSGTFEF